MKSPADLAPQLRRQWADTPRRLRQLLAEESAWPVELPIPLPSAARLEGDLQAVREHVQAWRAVSVGEVQWEVRRYRSTADAVQLPRTWCLRTPPPQGDSAGGRPCNCRVLGACARPANGWRPCTTAPSAANSRAWGAWRRCQPCKRGLIGWRC